MKTNILFVLMLWLISWFSPHLAAQESAMQMEPGMDKTNPTDATLTTFPFYDNVEDSAQSAAWWGFDPMEWQITRTKYHSGTKSWAVTTTGAFRYLTLASPINLSGAANPYISFWFANRDINPYTIYWLLEVSTNGGASWSQINNWSQSNSTTWTRAQVSLANYKLPGALLRIGVRYGGNPVIDDILIDNAPVPGTCTLTQPSNNGMKINWSMSTATDFAGYRIAFSTNPGYLTWDQTVGTTIDGRNETRIIDITDKNTVQYVFSDLTFTNKRYYAVIFEQDTQELFNQGTNQYELYTTFSVTPQNAPFVQNFEGAYQWAADSPWQVTTADASMPGHSTTHAFEDSPNTTYPSQADRWLVFQANCNTIDHPVLKFNHRYAFNQSIGDYGAVGYSKDNINWYDFSWFSGDNSYSFQTEELDLSMLHGQSPVYVRFRSVSGYNTALFDGWHVDDVEIANRSYTNAFPFFDDVEDSLASYQKWIPGTWTTYNAGYSGMMSWLCKPVIGSYSFNYEYLSFSGPIDLSTATNPVLKLWSKKIDYSFYIQPQVSSDGGNTWTSLSSNNVNTTMWEPFQWSLINYVNSNILIRIGVSKYGYSAGANVYCLIDNITIDNASTPGWISLSLPNNNGMKATWQTSTASDFSKYRLIISTSQSNLSAWDQTVGTNVTNRMETRVIDITDKNTTQMTFTDLVFTNTTYYARLYELNTKGIWNEGTDISELATTFTVTQQTAPFMQDFEGTFQWAADKPWAVTEADAGYPGHSPTHGYEDSPGGNYPNYADRWLIFKTNCSSVTHPVLRFKNRYNFDLTTNDYGELAYSTDNSNWIPLGYLTGNKLSTYYTEEYDLSVLHGLSSAFIRFRTYSGSEEQRDGWRLDDVEIYNSTRTTSYPFYDNVENDSLTNIDWIRGVWRTAPGGNNSLSAWKFDLPNSYFSGSINFFYLTLNGSVNLSGSVNPELSFWVRVPSSSEYYKVQVSTNGGTTWTDLSTGYFSGLTWSKNIFSLASYKQNSVMIRIGLDGGYNPVPVYIDDIMINEALTAPVLATPANASSNVAMPVSFEWNNTPGAAKYYLQVAISNTFAPDQIVFRDSTITTSAKTVSGLVSGNTYYWRVLAINMIEERGAWSGIWSFSTGASTSDVIALNAGWNLISFDVSLNPNTPAEVFQTLIAANNLQMVTGFQSQQGVFFDPTGLPFLNTLQNIVQGEGYWVKIQNAATLTVQGTAIPVNFTVNLLSGWNLISYWRSTTTTPATAFAALISAGKLQMVTGYELGGKFYDPSGPAFLNTLTDIKNGFGYWVKVNSNCTLTFP